MGDDSRAQINEPVQNTSQLEDESQAVSTPEVAEEPGVDAGVESANIPPVTEGQPEPISEPNGAIISSSPAEPAQAQNQSFIRCLLAKAGEKIQFSKNKKLEKIVELARQKNKITNADVCKVLRVSDSTAVRYLDTLEKQGRIKQIGKTGRDSSYQLSQ